MSRVVLDAEQCSELGAFFGTVFGPGRFTRAAYRIRERGLISDAVSDDLTCFEVRNDGVKVGAVLLTPIVLNRCHSGFLLGPIGVLSSCAGQGYGQALMNEALRFFQDSGCSFIFLVGDASYYARFGFEAVPRDIDLGGHVDGTRALIRFRDNEAKQCALNASDPLVLSIAP